MRLLLVIKEFINQAINTASTEIRCMRNRRASSLGRLKTQAIIPAVTSVESYAADWLRADSSNGSDNMEAKFLFAEYPVRDLGYEYTSGYPEAMKYITEHWEAIKFLQYSLWDNVFSFHVSFAEIFRLATDKNTPPYIADVFRKIATEDIRMACCERCGCFSYTLKSYRSISGILGSTLECIPCINRINEVVLKAETLLRNEGSEAAILCRYSGNLNNILEVGAPMYICGLKPTGYKHMAGRKQRGNRGVPIVEYHSKQIGIIESVSSDMAVCRLSDGSGTIEYPRFLPVVDNFQEFTDTLFLSFPTNHEFWGTLVSKKALDALRMKEFKNAYDDNRLPEVLRVAGIRYNEPDEVLPKRHYYIEQESWYEELADRVEQAQGKKDRLPYHDPYEVYRKRYARMTPEEKAVAESYWGDREEWKYIISPEPTPYESLHGTEGVHLWETADNGYGDL